MDLSFLLNGVQGNEFAGDLFQSLFLWIFRSYEMLYARLNNLPYEFQSLFLWIFRSYWIDAIDNNGFKFEFQSLFLWIFRSYVHERRAL